MADRVQARELTVDELGAARDIGRLAFGGPPADPDRAPTPRAGITSYGAFDRSGRLVGTAHDIHHHQWWGDREVSAADIGSVAVVPEARGLGASRALLGRLLEGARDRGAAVSALYPTVAAVYRSAGWAMVGAMRTVDIPTAYLGAFPTPDGLTVRVGDPVDLEAAARLATGCARARHGLLTHEGAPFAPPGDSWPDGVDGMTVVEEAGGLVGFATWKRASGYGAGAALTVVDIAASTAPAARALCGVLASWRTVAPTIRFRALPSGAVSRALPLETATDQRVARWMHRPVDVARAVEQRGWPAWVAVSATFELVDELAPWNTGVWDLEIAGGQGHLQRTSSSPAVRLGPEGFALLYCGAATPLMLAEAGLADGGADPGARPLEALMATPAPELLDYF